MLRAPFPMWWSFMIFILCVLFSKAEHRWFKQQREISLFQRTGDTWSRDATQGSVGKRKSQEIEIRKLNKQLSRLKKSVDPKWSDHRCWDFLRLDFLRWERFTGNIYSHLPVPWRLASAPPPWGEDGISLNEDPLKGQRVLGAFLTLYKPHTAPLYFLSYRSNSFSRSSACGSAFKGTSAPSHRDQLKNPRHGHSPAWPAGL